MADPTAPSGGGQEVLLVAYCNGNRCAGLRRLHCAEPAAGSPARPSSVLEPLHRAIRGRPRSLLVSTSCLGHCELAPMAALGWGLITDTGARWTHRPIGVGLIDRPGRVDALGQWIATTAPSLDTAPPLWPQPFQ